MRTLLVTTAILAACLPGSARADDQLPLFGDLRPGPHAVGFRTLAMTDASRDRLLLTLVWYRAGPTDVAAITVREATLAHLPGRPEAELLEREAATRRFFAQFGGLPDGEERRLLAMHKRRRRRDLPEDGVYPASPNALDSLSAGLEAAGQRDEALQVARQALEVLEKADVQAQARASLAKGLHARIERLSASRR